MSEFDFSLSNDSDAQEETKGAKDFATDGLMETLDMLTEMFTKSQQIYGQSIENLEKRLHALELEHSKLVTLLLVNTEVKNRAKTEAAND